MSVTTTSIPATDLAKRGKDCPLVVGRNILDLAYTNGTANLVANTAGTIAGGDASAASPNGIDVLQQRFRHKLWKFGSAQTAVYICIDMGSTLYDADTLVIADNNLNANGASVKVEADSTTPSGDPWGTAIWPTFVVGAGNVFSLQAANKYQARFWRIKISAAGAFVPQASGIFLGKAVQFLNKSDRAYTPPNASIGGTVLHSAGAGVGFISRTSASLEARVQKFTIAGRATPRAGQASPVSDPEIFLSNIEDFWKSSASLNGGARPFWYCEDPTTNPTGAKMIYPVSTKFDLVELGPFETQFVVQTKEQSAG